jgi:hypothetical protein
MILDRDSEQVNQSFDGFDLLLCQPESAEPIKLFFDEHLVYYYCIKL